MTRARAGVSRLARIALGIVMATVLLIAAQAWMTRAYVHRQRALASVIALSLEQRRAGARYEKLFAQHLAVWSGDGAHARAESARLRGDSLALLARQGEVTRTLPLSRAETGADAVEARLEQIARSIEAYCAWRESGGTDPAQRLAHEARVRQAIGAHASQLSESIDATVRLSEESGHRFAAELSVVFCLSIALLAGLVGFLLLPAASELRAASMALADYAGQVEEANAELDAQRMQLEQTNQALEHAQDRLEVAGARFRQLFLGLPVGCLGLDAGGRVFEWNRAAEGLLGRAAAELLERPLDGLLATPDGGAAWGEHLAAVRQGRLVADVECSTLHPDGRMLRLLVSIVPVQSPNGQVHSALASLMDITEQCRLMEALADSEALTRAALDSLDTHLALLDSDGSVVAVNEAWRAFAAENGQPMTDGFVGWNYLDVCERAARSGDETARDAACAIRDVLAGRDEAPAFEYDCSWGGVTRHFVARFSRFSAAGAPMVLVAHEDVTQRKLKDEQLQEYADNLENANARLQELASHDALTGLFNHYAFQQAYEIAFDHASRTGQRLSLILMDVDHFKQYNDAFGHPAGDKVLRRVAEILASCVRKNDLIARYGGEEFVAILPGADPAAARRIAQRICRSVAEADWPMRPVTISCGHATRPAGMESRAELVEWADRALYLAKAEGRNRVRPYDRPERAAA